MSLLLIILIIIINKIINNNIIISTDENPSLRIESSAIINVRGVSIKLYCKSTCALSQRDVSYPLFGNNRNAHFCFISMKNVSP